MSTLSIEQEQLLKKRKAQFDDIHYERVNVLITFLRDLGFENAVTIMFDAKNFLEPLSNWMKEQKVSDENRNWASLRFAYFIGEYFVQRYNGNWYVNERVESKYFAKIVVGKFTNVRQGVCIDAFDVAMEYVNSPEGRDLSLLCREISAEIEKYFTPNV